MDINKENYLLYTLRKIVFCCSKKQNKTDSVLQLHYKLFDYETLVENYSEIKTLNNYFCKT